MLTSILLLSAFVYVNAALAIDWQSLAASLSESASLHGPFQNSTEEYAPCLELGSDAFKISKEHDGLCMHSHACIHEFCLADSQYEIPSYTVEVKTEGDISKVFAFAAENDLPVSVKTTGHSYQGSSTQAGSVMIWMQNYEKDLSIVKDYSNSCEINDSHSVTHDVIGIGGGAVWDDVIEAVKDDYHIVTGGARTVSAIGGWLQGGGLSFSSRLYGIGVDQVVDMTVVLTNGTVVTIDSCSHPDLFWALRGGGGGTFGVVTHAHYKLYPTTTIIKVEYYLGAAEWAYAVYGESILKAIEQWFDFWIEKSIDLDPRWCGGFFSATYSHLLFCGSLQEAEETFLNDFRDWYDNVLDKSKMVPKVWGSETPGARIYGSWYDYKGGPGAYQNPAATDATGSAYEGVENMSARLMPRDVLINKPDEVKGLLKSILPDLGPVNYFLGGNIASVKIEDTSVNPALRQSAWSLFTTTVEGGDAVRQFIPNSVTGVCYNHHYGLEPDWRQACWGDHHAQLSMLKKEYDPDTLLNCWHCVGYDEIEPSSAPSPSPSARYSDVSAATSRGYLIVVTAVSFILCWGISV